MHSFGVTAFPHTSVVGWALILADIEKRTIIDAFRFLGSNAFMDHLRLQLRALVRH